MVELIRQPREVVADVAAHRDLNLLALAALRPGLRQERQDEHDSGHHGNHSDHCAQELIVVSGSAQLTTVTELAAP